MADRRNVGSTQSISGGSMPFGSGNTSSSSNAKFGTFFLGRYRVVDEIGLGGMASVHLARADGPGGFQKWVAIKRIHPHLVEDDQFIHMFLDEARIAARISHSNVAQVFDLGEGDGTYWIAMEYLHGEPLREVMRCVEEGASRMQTDIAAKVIADSAEGLHAAHDLRDKNGELLGLVHRDVTPHNLFVTYDGNVKVVDFGIAKVAGRLSSTRAGTLKGKLAYMSPEQVRGAEIDRRTDIFALGVVLWELTTGHRLFRMESDLETLEKVQACIVPPPSTIIPDYPVELESIVMRALAKAPEARFQTARDFSRALSQHLLRRGVFVGPEDVAGYVRAIFSDRIKKRDAHLRWAAEVTQTINIDEFRAQQGGGREDSSSDISAVSYQSELKHPPKPAAGSPAMPSNSVTTRPPARAAATPAPAPSRPYQPTAPLPPARPNPPPPASLAQTASEGRQGPAPLPAFASPGSGPVDDDDDDDDIATIVAPQRLLLGDRGFDPPSPSSGTPSGVALGTSRTVSPAAGAPAPYSPRATAPLPVSSPYGAPPQSSPTAPSPFGAPPAVDLSALGRQPSASRADPTMQLPAAKQDKPIALMVLLAVTAVLIAGGLVTLVALKLRSPSPAAAVDTSPATTTSSTAAAPKTPPTSVPDVVVTAPTATATASATATATASASPPSISLSSLPPSSTAPKATAAVAPTSAPPTPVPTPATADTTASAGGNGFLTVVCDPFCDSVTVAGRNLGPSPVLHMPFPPGQQRVTLKKKGSPAKVIPVVIVSGQTSPLRVKMD